MNKTLYKVIFNKKRGQMVAVAEHTARAGKSTQDSAPGAALSASAGAALRLPAICFSLLLAFGQAWIVPAHAAGIAADKAAPANQQPTILQTANGLPQVNIQTPTSAGVSVNQYRQFDVDGKGVILNNSRSNTATHTGGWIQGNPWLAGGEARVIVNQINSSNPSQLGGYIEVAGRRAEVIMANPAGIQVNGGGFINAAGITLTSGRPIINNGHLEGFRVRSGSVDVSGNGLDTSGADYTRILAQAATVNAGIWAQDLQISAGSNDIAANGATTAVSDGPSLAAAVAVDTGALGGMYAGKISLISTEKGVGIHNAGQLFAAAGGVSLAADGEIVNSGSIVAADKSGSSSADKAAVAIQAAHFHNSGSLSAQGAARIQTASLNNSGLLASAAELNIRNQAALANSGRINAARLDMETGRLNHSGHTTQTGSQDLAIEAANLHNRAGGLIGYTPIDSGNNGASDQGNSSHPSAPPTTATGGGRTESAPAPTAPQALPAGRISVSDGLDNSGSISANGNTDLSTHQSLSNQGGLNLNRLSAAGRSLSNTSGRISAHSADIRTDTFRNHSGSLQSSDGLNIHTQTLDNHQGTLQSAGSLHINSTALRNPSGRIAAPSISLAAAQHLDNTGGSIDAERLNIKAQTLDNQSGHIRSNEFTELNLSDGLANHGGQISSAGQLSIHDNQQNTLSIRNLGEILAGEDARIQAQSLANSGRLAAGRDLSIALQHNFSSQADIEAGRRLSIESAGRLNNRHTLQGGESVHLSATDIDNSAGGNIQSGSTTHLSAAQSLSNRGLINSNGLTLIEAGTTLLNSGSGRIYGNHVALAATDLINRDEQEKSAAIAARRQLDIGAQNITNQEGTLLSSEGRLNIGGRLGNTHEAEGSADTLTNAGARIGAQGSARIVAARLDNLNPHFAGEEYLVSQENITEFTRVGEAEPFFRNGRDGHFDLETHDLNFRLKNGGNIPIHKYGAQSLRKADYKQSVYKQRITSSTPGEIIIGGNLHISGDAWRNQNSQILAGGTIEGNLKAADKALIENHATPATVRTENSGYSRRGSYNSHGTWGDRHIDFDKDVTPVASPPATTEPFAQAISIVEQRVADLPAHAGAAAAANTAISAVNTDARLPEIRSIAANTRLPGSSLFNINPARQGYLIETDPAFTDYRQWLSSDYMLKALNVDPEYTHKRLGDGYYEQKLVNEQVARLTGYRRLDGYSNDEAQFKALMDSGLTFAKAQQLVPGIALSAEQVARLTSDIIWIESQTFTLPDGSQETVFAPKVYLLARKGDLSSGGGLLSADAVSLQDAGSIRNSGTIAGRRLVDLGAQDIRHSGLIQGGEVHVQADDGVHIDGGSIAAGKALSIQAKSIRLRATTATGGDERNGSTIINRTAALNVAALSDGLLHLEAAEGIQADGALISNASAGGHTRLIARSGHIDLGTVATAKHETHGSLSDAGHRHVHQSAETGTAISAAGDITLAAGGRIRARQSQIDSSAGRTALYGTQGIQLSEGRQTLDLSEATRDKSRGLISSSSRSARYSRQHDEAVGSSIGGREVVLAAGKEGDILVRGSSIISDEATTLTGRNIGIAATQSRYLDSEFHQTQKSGLSGGIKSGVVSKGYSKSRQSLQHNADITRLSESQIGSLKGNTTLAAAEQIDTRATTLSAGNNLTLQAQSIHLGAAYARERDQIEAHSKQSGISLGLNLKAPEVRQVEKRIEGIQNARRQDGALKKWQAWDSGSIAANTEQFMPAIGFSATHSRSQSQEQQDYLRAIGSSAQAGGTVRMQAGAGDLNIIGSRVFGEQGMQLAAAHDINIVAAEEQIDSSAQSSSKTNGLMGGGSAFSRFIGYRADTSQETGSRIIHSSSTAGSGSGDSLIRAGRAYRQTGSDVYADGNIDIAAQSIDIAAAPNPYQSDYRNRFTQKGITVGVRSPLIQAVETAQEAARAMQQVGESRHGRTNAMAAANAGWQAYQAAQSAQGAAKSGNAGGVSVSITYGEQRNSAAQSISGQTAHAANIGAQGAVSLFAVGAGSGSDIRISGADIAGQSGTRLAAENQIHISAAGQSHKEQRNNRQAGFNAGVALDFSNGVSFGITAGGNYGKGYGNSNEAAHLGSHIGSSQSATALQSGGSTTLKGAQVFGSSIELDAQSLHIESLQNRAAHQSRQYQGSAQITVGYGVSGSGDFSHSQIRADHASVAEQSGLFAGDGGYRVNVQQHTDLKGGLITSTEKAEAEHRNRFQTATLIHSDTHNHSKSKITRNPAAGRLRPTFNNTYKKIIINKVLHDMQRRRNMCST
ncbi:hemagglutinin repeat-containing protein [Uruburuella suis]|uniref:two-partner secretion domain-containing protein n=1 Tax=Uruburuella suis TaxID=252130 RepID=UPI0024921AFC|nr:hemagglutinin repeat-containing protein [Uruburuella suis]